MQRLKNLFTDDDSAVSPVIGVILMVAITVILAAVIASFVLGLGGNNEPAPSPTVSSSVDNGNITLDVTGGDDFTAGDATVEGEIGGSPFSAELGNGNVDEIQAGDTININDSAINLNGVDLGASQTAGNDPTVAGTEWEVQIIWNPADQDSTVIYSDSS